MKLIEMIFSMKEKIKAVLDMLKSKRAEAEAKIAEIKSILPK